MELDVFKLERTKEALRKLGLELALFSDFYNVSYLTGYTMFFENGPNPFTRGVAAALLAPGQVTLLAEAQEQSLAEDGWMGVTESFEGYGYQAPSAPAAAFIEALAQVMERELPPQARVGVEKTYLPAAAWERLQAVRPGVTWVDLPAGLMPAVRAVKSSAELERLRACAQLAEVGQDRVRELVQQPGGSEIEVYSLAKAAMEAFAGGRFALQCALHGGRNSAHVFPGAPTDYVLRAGDLIISDMVPYLQGYWGDTCSTYVVGGASAVSDEHRRLHRISRDAFLKGLDAVRPGITGGELDDLLRGYVRQHGYEYPHHTGHGLGVSNHEEPRIIIGGQTALQPGMVCVMEPGVYVQGFGGVR
jgi:Xaa-Pro aminopeptidase